MSSSTQTTLNRHKLYRISATGILNANSRHFIPISLLFIPLIFSAYEAVKFYSSSSSGTDVNTMFDPFNIHLIKTLIGLIASSQNLLTVKTIITILTFIGFVILPTVAGVALITYSANQAIRRKRITFSLTFKLLSNSYIPLLRTFIAGLITLIVICLAFTLSSIAVTEAIKALGFHFNRFDFSIFINTIVSYALVITIVFFIVIWGSAAAITVMESKSGFEALRQSANQSTEFRRDSFSVVFFTGYLLLPALYGSSLYKNLEPIANRMLILQIGAMCLMSSLMILLYVVSNTVLYVQHKKASDEETMKVKPMVYGEYVTLVVYDDDGDVEVVDELISNTGGFSYIICLAAVVSTVLLVAILFAKRKIG